MILLLRDTDRQAGRQLTAILALQWPPLAVGAAPFLQRRPSYRRDAGKILSAIPQASCQDLTDSWLNDTELINESLWL